MEKFMICSYDCFFLLSDSKFYQCFLLIFPTHATSHAESMHLLPDLHFCEKEIQTNSSDKNNI